MGQKVHKASGKIQRGRCLAQLHPVSVSHCQEPAEKAAGRVLLEKSRNVFLILSLSGERNWKQLSCTHSRLSACPLLYLPGLSIMESPTHGSIIPVQYGWGVRAFHAVHRNQHCENLFLVLYCCLIPLQPQTALTAELPCVGHSWVKLFTYSDFLNTVTSYFKHGMFLASPRINFSNNAGSQKKKQTNQKFSVSTFPATEQLPEHRQCFAVWQGEVRQWGLITRAGGLRGSIKRTRHTSCRNSSSLWIFVIGDQSHTRSETFFIKAWTAEPLVRCQHHLLWDYLPCRQGY